MQRLQCCFANSYPTKTNMKVPQDPTQIRHMVDHYWIYILVMKERKWQIRSMTEQHNGNSHIVTVSVSNYNSFSQIVRCSSDEAEMLWDSWYRENRERVSWLPRTIHCMCKLMGSLTEGPSLTSGCGMACCPWTAYACNDRTALRRV